MSDDDLRVLQENPDNNETINDLREEGTEVTTEPIKMTFMEILYGVITKPAATLRYVADTKPVLIGIMLYVAIAWVAAIAAVPGLRNSFRDIPPEAASMPFFNPQIITLILIIATPVLSVIGLFITSGIYHLIAKLFKGEGAYGGLLSVIGFSSFPTLLAVPFALFDFLVGRSGAFSPVDFLLASIHGLISFGISIWVLVLEIIGIRENYKFSTWRAVGTVFIPIAIAIVLSIIVAILLAAIIIGAAGSISNAAR